MAARTIRQLEVSMDQRFEQVDQRFAKIDERFEQVDQRFDRVEEQVHRLGLLSEEMNHKLDTVLEMLVDINGIKIQVRQHNKTLSAHDIRIGAVESVVRSRTK